MNLFAYVGGDPVNGVDPWGLFGLSMYGPHPPTEPYTRPPSPTLPIPFIKPPISYEDPDDIWDDKVDSLNSYITGMVSGTESTFESCECIATCAGKFVVGEIESGVASAILKRIAKKYATQIATGGTVLSHKIVRNIE